MRDQRQGFVWQSLSALTALREQFQAPRLSTALSIYVAMTEMANEQRRWHRNKGFEATQQSVADAAGVSLRTLIAYLPEFEQLGLVRVIRERDEKGRKMASLWTLEDVVASPHAAIAHGQPNVQPLHAEGAVVAPSRVSDVGTTEEQNPRTPPKGGQGRSGGAREGRRDQRERRRKATARPGGGGSPAEQEERMRQSFHPQAFAALEAESAAPPEDQQSADTAA